MPDPRGDNRFLCFLFTLLSLGTRRFFTVPQGHARIITVFGRFVRSLDPGLGSCLSLWGTFQKPGQLVPTKEQVRDYPKEYVFTRDGVGCRIDTVVFFSIADPAKAVFAIDSYEKAICSLVCATLRNECGHLAARELLAARQKMATRLRDTLDEDTNPWGIRVRLVEITEIELDAERLLVEAPARDIPERHLGPLAEVPAENRVLCGLFTLLTLGTRRFFTVPEGYARIVTVFGKFIRTTGPGLGSCLSLWQAYQKAGLFVPTMEQVRDYPKEGVFTRDGVGCSIDTVVFFQIEEPAKAVFEVEGYEAALSSLVRAILRNECGNLAARELLTARHELAGRLRETLEKDTDPWGIRVRLVEITEIELNAETRGQTGPEVKQDDQRSES